MPLHRGKRFSSWDVFSINKKYQSVLFHLDNTSKVRKLVLRSDFRLIMNKLEYISKQFQKAETKKYEHYVITRIWHLLNDSDIKIVAQQYVSRPNGKALTDLYFPQLKIHIEIDEPFHKKQKTEDKIREMDIVNATGHEVIRINVTEKSLENINLEIDNIVEQLNKKKSIITFQAWNIEREQEPLTYVKKGFIDLTDDCAFKTMVDAANCFGHKYKPKGIWTSLANHPVEKNNMIWFPKLYKNEKWNNAISDDEKVITENSTIKAK